MKIHFNLSIVILLVFWTALVVVLLTMAHNENEKKVRLINTIRAKELSENHLMYRRWASKQGGVYVPISEHTPPNPYLNYVDNREIITQAGDTFTLVNPAYMTRQVLEMAMEEQYIYGRLISQNPLNPANSPDSTEQIALNNFRNGDSVFSEFVVQGDSEYLRYIKPFYTEASCLMCHAHQGYKIGDLRGALSVNVPVSGTQKLLKKHNAQVFINYIFIWLAGVAALLFVLLRLKRNNRKRQELQKELLFKNEKLRNAIEELKQSNEEITVQKEKIRAGEEKLSKTLNGFDDAVYVVSPDYTIEYMNNAMRENLGKDCVGENCFKAVYGFDKECPWCTFEELSEEAPEMTYEAYNKKLGEHYQVKNILLDNNSKLTVYNNVTEIIESREALRESEKKYRLLAENVSDVLWIMDMNTLRFTYVSPAVCTLLGYTPEEFIQIRADKTLSLQSARRMVYKLSKRLKNFKENNASEHSFFDELQQQKKNGELIWIETATNFYYNSENKVEMLGVSRDISGRKKLEEEILCKNEELISLNATKDKFFSIIAHDLKNPFNTILGFSDLLLKKYQKYDDAKRLKMLEVIHSSGESTQKLLENLLEWSRSQTGRISFEPESLIFEVLLREILDLFEETAKTKDITLDYQIPESIVLNADKRMLSTILRNLISNAIKFTPRNGHVIIYALRDEYNTARISVSDTGVGMTQDVLEKLFKINEKVSEVGTEKEKGTGIGLLLCKEFIERHKGNIWVSSKPGEGSEFTFSLPLSNLSLNN
jgi:PAS domain S-box-containing protein